jgi:integrase
MLAAGYDVPYVQTQVGHEDPSTTLGIYARVISQPNRDRLRKRMEGLLRGDTGSAAPERDDQAKLF